jgi:hypothetical protein
VVAVSLPDEINQFNQFRTSFANSHKVNCGADADGYVHGGINVGLGCSGDSIKRCIDQNLGISGNTDYVCNTTGWDAEWAFVRWARVVSVPGEHEDFGRGGAWMVVMFFFSRYVQSLVT